MSPRRILIFASMIILLFSTFSWATLIEQDLFAPGDKLITADMNTNLYWLDLTVTQNMSYSGVLEQTALGGKFYGFRYATVAEVDGLQVSAGLPPELWKYTLSIYKTRMNDLIDKVGQTADPSATSPATYGITANPFDPTTATDDRILRYFSITYLAGSYQGVIDDDLASKTVGSWLVTDTLPSVPSAVPEPATLLLLASGLIGLAGLRRK